MAFTDSRTRKIWACSAPSALSLVWPIAPLRGVLVEWHRRRAYRNDLKRLLSVGEYMVRDTGLALDDVRHEIDKPFWRP